MEELKLIDAKITVGHQMPWHDCVTDMIAQATMLSMDKRLLDFLRKAPQMWAIHSAEFDWGHLGILSMSHIEPLTDRLDTEFLALPQKSEEVPEPAILAAIAVELEEKIFEDIDKSIIEMKKVMNRVVASLPITSTQMALEWARNLYRDRNPTSN